MFYGWWDYRFLSLIFLSTIVDYIIGLNIPKQDSEKKQKILLWCSVLFNLSVLGFFKYYNFFVDSWVELFNSAGYEIKSVGTLNIILPVGISFYTFQTMSYTIDIYKKKLQPTTDFISFASFVSFFPQLVAGPIEKAHNLIPQILKKRNFEFNQAKEGLFLIVYGMFKKVAIADNVSLIVDNFFEEPLASSENYLFLVSTILLYSVQIYCDFSGYSDIAIGVSKQFGINLNDNFRRPYFSKNPVEFWRKWHISLSTWFRDYVFIPLGGSKQSELKTVRNVFIVFVTSGLWHGANWTFIFWGIGHFIFYFLYTFLVQNRIRIRINSLSILITFLITTILWIPFRSSNISEAFHIFKSLFLNFNSYTDLPFGMLEIFKLVFLLTIFTLFEVLIEKIGVLKMNTIYVTIFLTIIIVLFGNFSRESFIYFQF